MKNGASKARWEAALMRYGTNEARWEAPLMKYGASEVIYLTTQIRWCADAVNKAEWIRLGQNIKDRASYKIFYLPRKNNEFVLNKIEIVKFRLEWNLLDKIWSRNDLSLGAQWSWDFIRSTDKTTRLLRNP